MFVTSKKIIGGRLGGCFANELYEPPVGVLRYRIRDRLYGGYNFQQNVEQILSRF